MLRNTWVSISEIYTYWNEDYLKQLEAGEIDNIKTPAREHKIICLSPKSGNIFTQKAERIFFEEGTGLSYMDNEDLLDYAKRNFPDQYEGLAKYFEEEGDSLYLLDFENVFTGLEDAVKDYLFRVCLEKSIRTTEEKTHIAMFILLQHMKNPRLINPWIKEFTGDKYQRRFEFFVNFRHFIEDAPSLYRAALPIVTAKWTLYNCEENRFPLTDNAVLRDKNIVFFPLSPKLLLEIDLDKIDFKRLQITIKQGISFSKYYDFEKLMIGNSYNYIVFPKMKKLEDLKQSELFKNRVNYFVKQY